MSSFIDEIEYKLDNVKATTVASGDIDKTFRSTSIGITTHFLIKNELKKSLIIVI